MLPRLTFMPDMRTISANASRAATLVVNPPVPTIVSSGAWGTSAQATYPTTYLTGPFVYPGASTLLLFLGDYFNFYNQPVPQPNVSDSCGNTWNVLAGPDELDGYFLLHAQYGLLCPESSGVSGWRYDHVHS